MMPSNCPYCKEPLCNSFYNGDRILHKTCKQNITHNFTFGSTYFKTGFDQVSFISIDMTPDIRAIWYPDKERFIFHVKCRDSELRTDHEVQYFHPQLFDYRGLIKKLKTYLTFS